jgi:hypothetical protein
MVVLLASFSFAQGAPPFAALETWRASVIHGTAAGLEALYSTEPPARVTVLTKSETEISRQDDIEFWTGLKARRISLKVSQATSRQPGLEQVSFEATVTPAPPGRTLYVVVSQLWQQQAGTWRLVAVERTDARRLEQPLTLDAKLYPEASGARQEIQTAIARAARTHKRVLVVFGADWCYDCHVLDKALRRPDIAPALNSNFEVVHVDVGQYDKNQDLVKQYQVPMSRGIPAIAVLDSDGKLLYSQKNGEFAPARTMGPEDLLAFLNKWKPVGR